MRFDSTLPIGWSWETLESIQAPVARPIVTGPFGSAIGSRFFVAEGVPVIRGNNLSLERKRFIDDGFVFLTEEKASEFKNLEARADDLVFTAAGTIGQVGIIPVQSKFPRYIISNKQMRARLDTSRVEPLFAYYWFTESYVRELICSRNTGSTIPLINLSVLRGLPIPVPPLDVQRGIVDVIGSLDDRIDLLRQTNATLESIGQALFKSWFIDFNPVRAKVQGREPEGMDAETAALFPDAFEDSSLGEIPKGWRVGTLRDAVEINPSRSLKKGADAPYLEMANAPTRGHRPQLRLALRAFGSGCKFLNNDALLAKITPCLENGKTVFVDFLDEEETGWGSTEFIVLRTTDILPAYCAYLLARHEPFRQFAIQAMTGTSGRQRVEPSRLSQFRLALPPDTSIASATAPTFNSIQSRIAANDEQAKTLVDLRDTLLPRLISGKLRLQEAAEEIEAVTA